MTGGRLDVGHSLDCLEPPAPDIAVIPASPAADTTPRIVGSVEAGTEVKVFAGAGCRGAVEATGTPAELGSTGLPVAVPTGSTKEFSALVETRYASSSCSTAVSFTDPGPAGETPKVAGPPPQSTPPPVTEAPACRPKGSAKRKRGALVIASSKPAAGAQSSTAVSLRLARRH